MTNIKVSVKKYNVYQKDYVRNPATCNCEIGKYLAYIVDDSAIIWWCYRCGAKADVKLSRTTKQVLMRTKQPAKRKIFIDYLHFY